MNPSICSNIGLSSAAISRYGSIIPSRGSSSNTTTIMIPPHSAFIDARFSRRAAYNVTLLSDLCYWIIVTQYITDVLSGIALNVGAQVDHVLDIPLVNTTQSAMQGHIAVREIRRLDHDSAIF